MCDPRGERPVAAIDQAELMKARRDAALFKLLTAAFVIATIVILIFWRRWVTVLPVLAGLALSLAGVRWAGAGIRARLAPAWRWEAARTALGLPLSFGRNCSWLAIREVEPGAVMEALPLSRIRPEGWQKGLRAAYGGKVFITRPIDEWVLVASVRLPDAGDGRGREPLTPFLRQLSKRLDATVMAFGTNPAVDYVHLGWAERGEVRRAYGYVGHIKRTLLDVGDHSLDNFAHGVAPGLSSLFEVAGRWSINPDELDQRQRPVGNGWVADIDPRGFSG